MGIVNYEIPSGSDLQSFCNQREGLYSNGNDPEDKCFKGAQSCDYLGKFGNVILWVRLINCKNNLFQFWHLVLNKNLVIK